MSDEQEHIDVVLEEPKKEDKDEPKVEIVDEVEAKPAKEAKKVEVTPDEGISELKKSLEREKQARFEAEKRAREAQTEAKRANLDKNDSQYQLVVNAIETVKQRAEALKTAYAESMSVGDYAKAAEIQNAMTVNSTQLEKLKDGKKAMKKQMKEAEATKAQPINPVSPPVDLVEQLASNVTPRSAEWLRSSKDYLRSEKEIRKMFRAHEDAIDDGIVPDTDEYFQFIEGRLGMRQREDVEEAAESPLSAAASQAPRRSIAPPAAPVSRGNGQRPNTMRLTKLEAETAAALGMSPEDYAKNKALLQKEGRYGH
jgi:hypothetical protein